MSEQQPLHRLFGLSWQDFCEGTALNVTPEMDLSVKQQFVDLVLSRSGPGPMPHPLPDGFEDLGAGRLGIVRTGRPLCQLPQAVQPVHAGLAAGDRLWAVRGLCALPGESGTADRADAPAGGRLR